MSLVLLSALLYLASASTFTLQIACNAVDCQGSMNATTYPTNVCLPVCHPCVPSLCTYVKFGLIGATIVQRYYATVDSTCTLTPVYSLPGVDCNVCVNAPTNYPAFLSSTPIPPSTALLCGGDLCGRCPFEPTSAPSPAPTPATPSAQRSQNALNFDRFIDELKITTASGCTNQYDDTALCANCPMVLCNTPATIDTIVLKNIVQPFVIPTSIGGFSAISSIFILSNSNLNGVIPTEIAKLTSLVSLAIGENPKLSGSIPIELTTITGLVNLVLGSNNLTGTIPTELLLLKRLAQLDLGDNRLVGTIPPQFGQTSAPAFSLDLSQNFLTGTVPGFLNTKLALLNLIGNQLTGTIPEFPRTLTQLYLGFNNLSSTIPKSFGEHRWDSLSFPKNQIFGTLPPLTINSELTAFDNNLTGLVPPIVGDVTSINLNNNQFEGLHPSYASTRLPFLLEMLLDSNRMPDLSNFTNMLYGYTTYPILRRLSLRNNSMTGSFLNDSENLFFNTGIRNLNLASNNLTGKVLFRVSPCGGVCTEETLEAFARNFEVISYAGFGNFSIRYNLDSNRFDTTQPYGFITFALKNFSSPVIDGFIGKRQELLPNFAILLSFDLGKQDFDECALGIDECEYQCVDGWSPIFNYTCGCAPDYFLVDGRHCQPLPGLRPRQIAGLVVGLLLFLLLGSLLFATLFGYYSYQNSDLHLLPKEISWSLLDYKKRSWLWETRGTSSSHFYIRRYRPDSEEFQRVDDIRRSYFDGGTLHAKDIFAIYNPVLTSSFINQWKITLSRRQNDAKTFFQERSFQGNIEKQYVIQQFDKLCEEKVPWNTRKPFSECPIIAAVHGTDYFVAEKIAQTGFVALSSLDAGYFAKGIYFTQLLHYTLTYIVSSKNPAIIISYINMGNTFAVTESHKGQKSLMGKAIKPGYQSHFVLTNSDGNVYDQVVDARKQICNEMVVSQESQILPAFIMVLDLNVAKKHFEGWMREVPTSNEQLQYKEIKPAVVELNESASLSVLLEDTDTTNDECLQSVSVDPSMLHPADDRYYKL